MISTVVFSLVLLAATAALVQISRMYYRGITSAKTQEVARNVMDEISQSIQFSGQTIRQPSYPGGVQAVGPEIIATQQGNNADTFYFCIGPKRYSFAVDRMLTPNPTAGTKQKRHVLWVDQPLSGCADSNVAIDPVDLTSSSLTDGRELLQENMRITKLSLFQTTDGLWNIDLSIVYGEDDLLAVVNGRQVCEGSSLGVEFCAIAELSSKVYRRITASIY
jgi:hypothetical protein